MHSNGTEFNTGDLVTVRSGRVLAAVCKDPQTIHESFSIITRMFKGETALIIGEHPEYDDVYKIVLNSSGISGWVQGYEIEKA